MWPFSPEFNMRRILPLRGKYGGFDTFEEWRADMEAEGKYDPVLVGLDARTEAAKAKQVGWLGTGISLLGLLASLASLFLCR